MKNDTTTPKSFEAYFSGFPPEVQVKLEKLRQTINKAAPGAEEVISYKMPAFRHHGMLVYFAAYKNHIGFYAAPTGHTAFKKELSVYKEGKGSVQFPLDKPLPLRLVSKIVKFRVKENVEREKVKKKKYIFIEVINIQKIFALITLRPPPIAGQVRSVLPIGMPMKGF